MRTPKQPANRGNSSYPDPPQPPEYPTDNTAKAAMIAGIALLIGAIVGAFAMRAFVVPKIETPGGLSAPPIVTVATGPTVLNAIQSQAKLETVVMSLAQDTTVARHDGPFDVCSEMLTYLGYFNVTAGVDLSKISTQNIAVKNDGYPDRAEVRVLLPPAEIMHVEVDTKNSRTVAKETPKWIPGCNHQIDEMALKAQRLLQANAKKIALERGIIVMAQDKAAFEVRKMLLDAGYKNVTVQQRTDTPNLDGSDAVLSTPSEAGGKQKIEPLSPPDTVPSAAKIPAVKSKTAKAAAKATGG